MKVLPSILLLLLAIFITVHTKKTEEILKNVMKRFRLKGLSPVTQNQMTYDLLSEEHIQESRNYSSHLVAENLIRQSSSENLNWETSARILMGLMSFSFVGGICGGENMNYGERVTELTWHSLPVSDPKYNSIIVSFRKNSTWDYSSIAVYIIQMQIMPFLKPDSGTNYTITEIREIGACTEHGDVEIERTDVYWNLHRLREMRNMTYEQFKRINDVFDVEKDQRMIPFPWLKLMPQPSLQIEFEGSVCRGDSLFHYTQYELLMWWKRFQIMYHLVSSDLHAEKCYVQPIAVEKDRLVFRATFNVQIGAKLNDGVSGARPMEKWDFKFQLQYNVTGDDSWWLDKFEVMCKPIPRTELMQRHAQVYREILGSRLSKMVKDPNMWYSSISSFKELFLVKIEIDSCGNPETGVMEKFWSLEALEKKLWQQNKDNGIRMEGFDAEDPYGVSVIGEQMTVDIYIIWTPLKKGEVHESKWTFHLEWDDFESFVIKKMILGCPTSGEGHRKYTDVKLTPYPRVGGK
ncbi:hypothetical protein CAEBREN_23040 [Caenorhabditis brenneri]|uniref:NTF2-like domain-containing protein n=1 Tax=Caenorhabditis brenneri TaxID=135651 RepID=G0NDG8_CAEBE|nr:hypothetical protein CAEBREN_23040 [Caenorhabditis brenneri]